MSDWDMRIYRLWRQRYPEFDHEDYARWVRQHGFYDHATDPARPAFYEYAGMYVQQRLALESRND